MAETSGLGHAGRPGWRSSGTPHYSGYAERGFYRSRARPRNMNWDYLSSISVRTPDPSTVLQVAVGAAIAATYAGRLAALGYLGYLAVSSGGVATVTRTPIIRKLAQTATEYARRFAPMGYDEVKRRWQQSRPGGGVDSVTDPRRRSRRRRFQYEYAYKF